MAVLQGERDFPSSKMIMLLQHEGGHLESVIVAGAEPPMSRKIRATLGTGFRMGAINKGYRELLLSLRKNKPHYLFVDLVMLQKAASESKTSYQSILEVLKTAGDSSRIIILSSKEMAGEAVMAVKAGASDYLTYPLDPLEIRHVLENIQDQISLTSELDYLRDRFWQTESLENIRTRNARMRKVFEMIRSVAPTKSTVLLLGETGTGKGLLARIIHTHSNRGDNQFISVHCGAIPDTLLESELFGHEKGAFTGAVRKKLGKFEMANGGTIFLDEVGTLTAAAQIKLLQVLQDGTFQRVGGEETIRVDVRVISATNVALDDMCLTGEFRKDLYYRLNVFPIEIPPLKGRVEDIPQLAMLFLKKLEAKGQKGIINVDKKVMEGLKRYPWPGNIRELENLMERAYILGKGSTLLKDDFPDVISRFGDSPSVSPIDTSQTLAEVRRNVVAEAEKAYLMKLLTDSAGKLKSAAEVAGITTRQLHKLMKKHSLQKEDFKV
ncbi:sigma-54 interaction domain protein [delta proteobacterium NaphS2]|nr:sigma-54 interaction domain protein [delta proteobacterium NaphS2]